MVTLPTSNLLLVKDIEDFFPNCSVIEIKENVGYDIYPFIKAIETINLDKYDYLIKLHTKRDMFDRGVITADKYHLNGKKWRKYLLSFISNKNHFNKCIRAFKNNKDLGMVNCTLLFDVSKDNEHNDFDDSVSEKDKQTIQAETNHRLYCLQKAKEFVSKLKVDVRGVKQIKYIAGSMFMCRASILKPLQKADLTKDDFSAADRQNENDLAHILERVFGLLCSAQGFTIEDPFTLKLTIFRERFSYCFLLFKCKHRLINKFLRFIFRKDFVNGFIIIKIFKITVLKRKI